MRVTCRLPHESSLLVSIGRFRASMQRRGITGTVECLPERMIRVGFEIGHFDHDPIWTASVADLCADPLS